MLERDVRVGGLLCSSHEVETVTIDAATGEALARVRSSGTSGEVASVHAAGVDASALLASVEAALWALPAFAEDGDPVALLEEVAALLDDGQAARVPRAFPEWEAGASYDVGDRARHGGSLWTCLQAHGAQQGWEPPATPALWRATAPEGTVPAWSQPTGAHDAYAMGDRVTHAGKVWESLVDGNVWEPGATGAEALWAEV